MGRAQVLAQYPVLIKLFPEVIKQATRARSNKTFFVVETDTAIL
jgi:hypothetical protein